jgi:flagellar basal body-associated protein FliL
MEEKKKSKIKIIILIVAVVIIVIVGIAIITRKDKEILSISDKPSSENIEVLDWETAIEEYEENQARAKEKYVDKWYNYTGIVTEIGSTSCRVANIVTLNYYNYHIEVSFKDTDTLKKLNKGDEIVITGKLTAISEWSGSSKMVKAELKEVKSTGNTFYIK